MSHSLFSAVLPLRKARSPERMAIAQSEVSRLSRQVSPAQLRSRLGPRTSLLVRESKRPSRPCLVTVYATGSSNKASIYADNLVTPTPLGNPFTANVDGSWTFYVPTGACYDITLSTYQGPPLPYLRTYSDVCFGSGSGSGTITGVTPGGFLLLTGSMVGFQGCSVSGQVPTWNGATRGCGTPGSGSVVSVTGTANEIVVTNPTTTPQIFLANPGITPGDRTVGATVISTTTRPSLCY